MINLRPGSSQSTSTAGFDKANRGDFISDFSVSNLKVTGAAHVMVAILAKKVWNP